MSRSRMPHNNRVSGSNALKTNDIWSKTIGYDPYAAKEELVDSSILEREESLRLLVKMSNVGGSESRGGCKKCGKLGHLTFQCRNTLSAGNYADDSSSSSESDADNLQEIHRTKRVKLSEKC